MNVDLPAPFGPSSPVTPGGTDTLTSLRPMTWPYHLETCSAVTIAVIVLSRGFAPRTPLHALSLAASPARSDRVAHSLSLVRRPSRDHLDAADSPLEDRDGDDDQADDDQRGDLPRRGVARLQPEDDVDHLRDVRADRDPGDAAAAGDRIQRAVDRRGEEGDAEVEDRAVSCGL